MNENILNIIISITKIIFYVTLTILAIYLVIFLKKFLSSISKIEDEVVELAGKLTPVIMDLKFITDDIKLIADRSRYQFRKIESLSEELVDKGTGVLNVLNKVQSVSSGIVLNLDNFVSAITKGVKTFGNKLKNGSQLELKSFD